MSFSEATAGGGQLLRDALDTHGYAHVRGVLSDAALVHSLVDNLKGFIQGLGFGGRFDDAESVALPRMWPPACSAGIMGEYGAGHTEAAWRVRLHANVRALFAAIWGTSELVTSVDGINAERPHGGHLSDGEALLLHSDSNPFKGERAKSLVQGVVSLTPTRAGSGGTTVVARSHLLHQRLFASREAQLRGEGSHAFVVLNAQERAWLRRQASCELVHIETEPGDMVLFSSRTVHCGRRAREPTTDWRFATYVCMAPASTLSELDRQRKACVMGLAEWPHNAGRHQDVTAETTAHPPNGKSIKPRFGWGTSKPEHVSNGITEAPALALTPEALQLAGVLPYSCEELAPGTAPRRSGGQQAADAADLRAKRVKRFSADEDEVIVIDGPQPVSKKPKPAADEAIVID